MLDIMIVITTMLFFLACVGIIYFYDFLQGEM